MNRIKSAKTPNGFDWLYMGRKRFPSGGGRDKVERVCNNDHVGTAVIFCLTMQKKIPKFIDPRKNFPSQSAVDNISQPPLAVKKVVQTGFVVGDYDTVPEILMKFGINWNQFHSVLWKRVIPHFKMSKGTNLPNTAGEQIFVTKRKARL